MKARFGLIATLPLVALVVACSSGDTPITAEEAAVRFNEIYEAQDSREVADRYGNIKIVASTKEGEETSTVTLVYSGPNDYYCLDEEDAFIGIYEIDGVMTVVASSSDGVTSSNDATEVASSIVVVESAISLYTDTMLETAGMIVQMAIAYASAPDMEESVSFSFSSKGEGSLVVRMNSEESTYDIAIENNVVASIYSESVDDGVKTIASASYFYDFDVNDCRRIIP